MSDLSERFVKLFDDIEECDVCNTNVVCDYHDAKYEQLRRERRSKK